MIATNEYELLTDSAGLVDRSERAKFVVRGSEAVDFLQGQVSNDVESLTPGSGCYATILNHKGKLRTDLRILRGKGIGARPAEPGASAGKGIGARPAEPGASPEDDFLWLDTEAVGHAVLRHMLATYALGRDVQWEDLTEDHVILSLIGPGADGLAPEAPPPAEHSFTDSGAGLWVRTDLGLDVLCGRQRADELRAELGVEEVSEEAAECLRIESGRPRLGIDMDAETMPQEAGINERAVDFEKGCYVGQETVARLHWRGKPNRHLRGLRLSEPVERRTDIVLGEKVVGRVSSTCVSPRFGPIALALVRREASPGDTVRAGAAEAEVVELPFVTRG